MWNTEQLRAEKTRSAHRLSCCQDTWPGFCHQTNIQSKHGVGAFITPLTALWLWVMDISVTDDFSIICDLMFQLCGVPPGSFPVLHSVVLVSTGRLLLLLKLFPHIPQETASCPCESSCGPSSCRSEWTVSRTVNKNTASPLEWRHEAEPLQIFFPDVVSPTCRFSRGSLRSSDFGDTSCMFCKYAASHRCGSSGEPLNRCSDWNPSHRIHRSTVSVTNSSGNYLLRSEVKRRAGSFSCFLLHVRRRPLLSISQNNISIWASEEWSCWVPNERWAVSHMEATAKHL